MKKQLWKMVASEKAMEFYGLVLPEKALYKIAECSADLVNNYVRYVRAEDEDREEVIDLLCNYQSFLNGKILGMVEVFLNLRFPVDTVRIQVNEDKVELIYNITSSGDEFVIYEFPVDL